MISMVRNKLRIAMRLAGLLCHVGLAIGLALLFGVVRLLWSAGFAALRARLTRWWLSGLGRLLGLRVETYGLATLNGTLLVANHISWLDIIVLATSVSGDYVAKQEVRGWPLLGWLAQVGGTLFVRRGDFAAAQHTEARMVERMKSGRNLILFPEGTTTDGRIPGPFKPRLFRAAIRAAAPVQPICISYPAAARVRARVAFLGDQSLLENLWGLLALPSIPVTVRFMPTLSSEAAVTRSLASAAWSSVAQGSGHTFGPLGSSQAA